MKGCNGCKTGKDESKFHKKKANKNGLASQCKECRNEKSKDDYQNKRDEKLQYQKEHYENNKEKIGEKRREGYKGHKEEINRYGNSPLEYSSNSRMKKDLEKYEEVRQSVNGNVMVKCAYEGQGFEPTKSQIQNRLLAINGEATEGAEHRLYCSEACKQSCPIYNKKGYERGYEPASSREVQSDLRKMRFEIDNWACQKCGRTRVNLLKLGLVLHCHHKEGIHWEPLESADIDECITYCEECHREVHKKEGCKPSDMKCSPEGKYNS